MDDIKSYDATTSVQDLDNNIKEPEHDPEKILPATGTSQSHLLPELLPQKKAVPEHIDHDHNLARNPVTVTKPPLVQHQVPLMPQQIHFTNQSDISHELLSGNIDSSEVVLEFVSNQEQPEHISQHLQRTGDSGTDRTLNQQESQQPAEDGEEIVEITIDDDEISSKESPKKRSKTKAIAHQPVSPYSQSQKITIQFNGGSLVVERFMYNNCLCRICLLEREYLVSIFEDVKISEAGVIANARGPNSCNRYNMATAIQTLLDIDAKVNDGLPSMICIDCIDSMMSFSAFKKRIGCGQQRLSEVLAQVKDSATPTYIPALGDYDKSEIYRHSESIINAKKVLETSPHSHLVSRRIPDKIWEKLFTTMILMMGCKSAKLKELEQYVMSSPFVKAWFCSKCNLTFHGSQDVFIQHCLNSHGVNSPDEVKFPCDVCGEMYNKSLIPGVQEIYTEHWVQHFYFHQCEHCGKKMPSVKSLWVHKRSVHAASEEVPAKECDVCGKSFKRIAQLVAHKKTHLDPVERSKLMNKCPICEKSLTGSVSAHIASMHSEIRPWKCDICLKCFKRKETLMGHRSTVHNSTKYQCDICGIFLSSQSIKKTHEFRHKGIKPHKCDQCDQSFFDKTALKSHQIAHKEIADISCRVCDKTFKRQMYLKEHMRIHSDEKPFECPICKRRIRIRANYYKHLKVHKKNGTFDIPKPAVGESANNAAIPITAVASS